MMPNEIAHLPTAAIVTALPKEFAAVKAMFSDFIEFTFPEDPNDYVIAVVTDGDVMKHYVPITLLKKMGNNTAASAARDVLRTFTNVRDVLMVGIAGGVPHPQKPEDHVRLGDLCLSTKKGVVQFDLRKLADGIVQIRDTSPPPSARILGLVNRIEADRLGGDYPWEDYIKSACEKLGVRRPNAQSDQLFSTSEPRERLPHPKQVGRRRGQPLLHYGVIGSSNTLLKDAKERDALRDDESVIAVEMEGSGIADGAWVGGENYFLVRGICDYADQNKNDKWQAYAAIVAGAFARCLVDGVIRTSPGSIGSKKK